MNYMVLFYIFLAASVILLMICILLKKKIKKYIKEIEEKKIHIEEVHLSEKITNKRKRY